MGIMEVVLDELVKKLINELHEPFQVEERKAIARRFLAAAYIAGMREVARGICINVESAEQIANIQEELHIYKIT